MDVVGSLGYIGQPICFLDGERFAYQTGNSLCIYDTTKGPREMIWKMDCGLSCFAACLTTQSMLFTPTLSNNNVEIVNTIDQTSKGELINPATSPIIFLAYARDGDKIYGITGTTDHRLLVWSNQSPSTLLINKDLSRNFRTCLSNPCNSNQIVLFGDNGIMVGVLAEVLGNYSIKLDAVDLDNTITRTDEVSQNVETGSTRIAFVLWLPLNRILFADTSGNVYEYRVETKKVNSLGHFAVPDKRGNNVVVVPTHAVLSVNSLMVGTEQGVVYWYPVLNLMSTAEGESPIELQIPSQACHVKSAVSSLSLDQNYLTLLIGTLAGDVLKVAVDVAESEFSKMDQDQDLLNSPYGGADASKQSKAMENVVPVQMGSDPHSGGVILCTSHITIEVQKFSARSKSSLSMFITGSHLGSLLFWRYSSQVVDSMTPNAGIRRSAPRALRSVFQLGMCLPQTQSRSNGHAASCSPAAAVCAVELVSLPMRHAKLLLVGTEDGGLEVWTLEAQENEDEDAKDSATEEKDGHSVRLLEDDEGSCLVRLEARRIFQAKLFQCPVSLFASFPMALVEKDQHLLRVAVASDMDNRIYFFNAIKEEHIAVQKGVEAFLTLEEGEVLRSMSWTEDMLLVFCEGGNVFVYQTKDCEVPLLKRIVTSGLTYLVDGSLTASAASAVFLDNSCQVQMCLVHALHDEKASLEFRSLDHSDVVVVVAHAPNGRYFATGCVDGSLYVWRIDMDTEEVTLANKVKPHAGSVSAVAFSSDSSLIMSSGIDGSCFFITLDKPTFKGPNRNGSIKASFVQEEGPQYLADILPEKNSGAADKELAARGQITWMEQREVEKARDLKSRHKFKAMGISAAINEIGQRLRVLVSQNAARSHLEILDRGEFVIDVDRKDAVLSGNLDKAASTRRLYEQRNLCNELRAARIRAKCFDKMEVKPVALLPLGSSCDSAVAIGVTSYSVLKYTSVEQAVLSKVKRLRGMEVRAQRLDEQGVVTRIPGTPFYRCAWFTSISGCPPGVSWISNDGTRWPVSDKISSLLASDKATDAGPAGTAAGGKDKSVPEGLSAPSEVDDDDGSVDSREDQDIDENNVMNLIYPPQAVRSQVQKRTQIVLLREVVRQLKVKFNEQLEKLRREKADIIGAIESRNTRMRVILEDLHQQEDLFAPALGNQELTGTAVLVDASELRTLPYESELNRAARLREEEEKRLRDLANDKEDVKGRALDEMMFGTLEVKRDVFAEASAFVRPEWMDTLTTAEMNEAQLKEYDAYVSKLKTLQEEQTNYRKSLEQEMKRLKNEVAEVCKSFDEKLTDLVSLKVLVHREIFSQEIYISRLSYNMAKTEQTFKFLRRSEEQVQSLRVDRAELKRSIEKLSTELEDMKGKINAIQEEERQLDKIFPREMQNLTNTNFDQNAIKVLKQLFRQRVYPRGGYEASEQNGDASEQDASASASKNHRRSKDNSASARGGGKHSKSQSKRAGGGLGSSSTNDGNKQGKRMKASKGGGVSAGGGGGKDSMGPMQQAAQALRSSEEANYKDRDPYYEALLEQEKVKLMQESQIPLLSVQSIELNCPEGFEIDQFSWSKLQELRTARIEKEIEGKLLSIEFSKLKQKLERLDAEDSMIVTCISDIKLSRDLAVRSLEDLDSNLDIIVRLRQGQDEVDKDAMVTDYGDALLVPITVLAKYNSRIKELGREKISVLSKIKLFRRKINLIDWEAKHFGLEARHYEAYLTDLQLFRVTRMLQKIIREGSDATLSKEKLEKVAIRIEYQSQDAEVKLLALKKNNELIKRQLEDRSHECNSLEEKIQQLKVQVNLSKSVKFSRDEARGGTGGDPVTMAATKMKKVVSRRHMVDTARAQAEEIDYLRQELDKMRQRTFPSFVRATRKRLTAVNAEAI